MPDFFTFSPATVLNETTGGLAIGALGVLRVAAGGEAVPVFDLNGSALPNVQVGQAGAHQAFLAEIAFGVLDFGSVVMTKVSDEAMAAAIEVKASLDSISDRVSALESGTTSGFGRVRALSRVPTAADADEGDLVLVHPNFFG